MAIFTELSEREIADIAHAFGLGRVRACTPILVGTINSNFQVDTERGRFAVRVNEGKSEADVHYEAGLVVALSEAGVAAPRPCMTTSGEPVLRADAGLVSVFPWVLGVHVHAPDIQPEHARVVGVALARLHLAGLAVAERFERAGIYTFERIVERFRSLETHPEARPGGPLEDALAVVRDEISWLEAPAQAQVRAAAPRGVIHNDLFPENVLFEPDAPAEDARVAALIDFEQASTGSLAYDLAVCINAWCADDIEPTPGALTVDPTRVRALVKGYESVRPLNDTDRDALAVEVRYTAVRFTVTRITDVYLRGLDQRRYDFRHFLRRLRTWREIRVMDLLEARNSRK